LIIKKPDDIRLDIINGSTLPTLSIVVKQSTNINEEKWKKSLQIIENELKDLVNINFVNEKGSISFYIDECTFGRPFEEKSPTILEELAKKSGGNAFHVFIRDSESYQPFFPPNQKSLYPSGWKIPFHKQTEILDLLIISIEKDKNPLIKFIRENIQRLLPSK